MPEESQFRTEHFQDAPRGWHVKTITHPSGHEVRVAFPKGPRKRGSGRLVSILHPHENPGCGLTKNPIEWEAKWEDLKQKVQGWLTQSRKGAKPNAKRNYTIDHSILSPSGHVSKRTRHAALARETSRLFPEGLAAPKFVDTRTDRERLLHQAKELRELAARGMHPRKYAKEAARLEALAAEAL